MTIARAHLVDPSVTRWYHCVTRCVRRAFLLGEGMHDRKTWIEHRLEELAEIFSVAVAGFAILDNHLHLLVRLDPEVAQGWSDEDVVRRWGRLFPPRDKARQVVPISDEWVQARLKDARWVATARQRLQSLSWFMKCLKEPLSLLANREEQTRGAFFEGRFKSVAILFAASRARLREVAERLGVHHLDRALNPLPDRNQNHWGEIGQPRLLCATKEVARPRFLRALSQWT
jgi:hypothetical protein